MIPLILAGAGLLLGGASAIASHKSQNNAAKESERAAAEQKRLVTEAAGRSALFENKQIDMQLDEQQLAFDQQIQAIAARRSEEHMAGRRSILASDRAARMADGTARLSAGAAGVAGASVDAVLSDVGVQAANSRTSINDNVASVDRQLDRTAHAARDTFFFQQRDTNAQREGVEANRLNRIAGVSNIATAPRANPFATALQIGGALLDFGSSVYNNRPSGGK